MSRSLAGAIMAAGGGSAWDVTWHHSDFGDHDGSTHDFKTVATETITPDTVGDPVVFTAENAVAYADTLDLDNATGLRMAPTNFETNWHGPIYKTPNVQAMVTDLVPGYDGNQIVAIQARMSLNMALAANYDATALVLTGTSKINDDFVVSGRSFGAPNGWIKQNTTSDVFLGTPALVAGDLDVVHEIIRYPGGGISASLALWGGDFAEPWAVENGLGLDELAGKNFDVLPADLRVALTCMRVFSGTAGLTATVKAMRVAKLR